jgi:hypothetical protein
MVQPLMPLDQIGSKRTGSNAGGLRQKYFLDEPGRRLILAKYDGRTEVIDELAERLKVPRWVVMRWARGLGLTRRKEPPWTQEEMNYLERYLHKTSIASIAKHLGRTQTAVQAKAKRLGASKTQEGYTMSGLCLGLGCDEKTVKKWIERGWLRGQRRKTERTEGQGDIWYFSDAAIRELVRKHPEEIDPRRADWLWLVDVLLGGLGPLPGDKGESE